MNFTNFNAEMNQEENIQETVSLEPTDSNQPRKRRSAKGWQAALLLFIYLIGLGSGYKLWGQADSGEKSLQAGTTEIEVIAKQTFPEEGFLLPVTFGDLGIQMIKGGVFNRDQFIQVYQEAGQPLTEDQISILDGTYTDKISINHANAYFLLNFLWALGLSNKNSILDSGLIQQYSENKIENFASTGGWTLAIRPIGEVFSSLNMINLTVEQQKRVEETAAAIFRPCCNNPTLFPDCNHGMAMLGLLELMASQDATVEEMMQAAKYVNAFWFPQQTLEQAIYFKKVEGKAYQDVDARTVLGPQFSSVAGFAKVHQLLSDKQWLPAAPNTGGSCGV
ncbi:MAG: hypothetical protein Q8N39_08715 [Pelolinea sp.]|nr:hypothetical protein [Pelolinea sp.]